MERRHKSILRHHYHDDDKAFASKDKVRVKMDCRREALIWSTISAKLREERSIALGSSDKSSNDVHAPR